MSEEAAAAVELDAALEKASHSNAHKAFSDSARPETKGLNGASQGNGHQERPHAASQAAAKVGGDTLWCAAVFGGWGLVLPPPEVLDGGGTSSLLGPHTMAGVTGG